MRQLKTDRLSGGDVVDLGDEQSHFRIVRPGQSSVEYSGMRDAVLEAQQQLILQWQSGGLFQIAGQRPDWFAQLAEQAQVGDKFELVEVFPFLELFLDDAMPVWEGEHDGARESDLWAEQLPSHVPIHLRAIALRKGADRLLAIEPLTKVAGHFQGLMDKSRSHLHGSNRLKLEHHYKETMLHCLIHDLVGSLSVAEVVFRRMLERQDLTEDESRSLEVGQNSMHSVSNQLRSMVDVFAAEMKEIEHYETDPDLAPDMLDCVMMELVNCGPAFGNKDVRVEADLPDDAALRWPVVGEQNKLERIIFNLLENALRYSPRGGQLRVSVTGDAERVRFAVEDEGPGVPEEMQDRLFDRFSKDRRGGGKGGLGLFFAGTMIKRWGGVIGHAKPERGGACFWFELPRAVASD